MSDLALSLEDRRIIAALQCDPRVSIEHLASVLGLGVRPAGRRLNMLLDSGDLRFIARTPPPTRTALMLRIHILSGKLDQLGRALARREDIPYIDASIGGDELAAVLIAESDVAGQLIARQLPASGAITAVEAHPILHVFSEARDWRLDVLSTEERRALTPPETLSHPPTAEPLSTRDAAIIAALGAQPRASAAQIAARIDAPESTVRRRLTALRASDQLLFETAVNPARVGLPIDVNFWMRVSPRHLDAVGQALARHPAVHGTLAIAGAFSLNVAAWFASLDELYRFTIEVLAELPIESAEPVVVGSAIKRPGLDRTV
ncbi:Lrp/AsnC family transcriptional regulator [Mycetocola sp. JXN-3]|uniref:Lrp/AsnC family transcriptional regulator n=1 Tax=Mycetocola sp. JXN-3 TaxID=2116510 RepID=UPI00165D17ED|nr:Lrp/AsnC family transcriptional regulator [Mycetocola sp. JXN-3]